MYTDFLDIILIKCVFINGHLQGFYAVFCDVFRKIDEEDSQYKDDANDVAPLFGGPESSYDEVCFFFKVV